MPEPLSAEEAEKLRPVMEYGEDLPEVPNWKWGL